MISFALALALASTPESEDPGFGFDRVDLISEAPGTFLNYDLPLFGTDPMVKAVRFVEQVTVSLRLPLRGLYLGLSIGTQSLTYEHPLVGGLFATGTLQTRLLFPSGANLGVAWRAGIFRIGASVSMTTQGTWISPGAFTPQFLPALGIGIGLP